MLGRAHATGLAYHRGALSSVAPPPAPPPVVRAGSVISYRMFDIGDDIAFARAVTLLRESRHTDVTLAPRPTGTMDVSAVPLRVELGLRTLTLPRLGATAASCSVRLFPTGIASVGYAFPIAPGTPLDAIVPLCQELYAADSLVDAARAEVDAIVAIVKEAIAGYHVWDEFEDYTIVSLRELEGGLSGVDLQRWPGLPNLVLGETSEVPIADKQRKDILQYAYAYLQEDLVVVDWNSAVVLDPSGGGELVDVLEFANSLLLNLRYYDDLFDIELRRIYAELSRTRRRSALFNPYAQLAQQVMKNLVGLGEIIERIDNAIKVAGDTYVARIYRAAIVRLRIEMWNDSIGRKQRLVTDVYTMFKGEAELRKSQLLEIAIVVLIVIEVVVALTSHLS